MMLAFHWCTCTGGTILEELQQIKEQQAAQAAATAEVLAVVSRTKQSITIAADVGVEVQRRSAVVPISDILQHSYTEVPAGLTAVNAQWEAGTEEKHLQDPLFQAYKIMLQHLSTTHGYVVLDTHLKDYYKCPTARSELKSTLQNTTMYHEVLGQLKDRWDKLSEQQPMRQFCISAAIGKTGIEILRFSRSGDIKRTGIQPLSWCSSSTGYQLLAAYLKASLFDLGYCHPPMPEPFIVSGGRLVDSFNPLAIAPRPFTYVYKVSCGGATAVLKVSAEADIDKEVAVLNMLQNEPCVPRVLASGVLPGDGLNGSTAYFIISPFGQHLGSDVRPAIMHAVVRDVASAIGAMEVHGLVHRDISPSNIIMANSRGVHVLLDFHVAERQDAIEPGGKVTGKSTYHALSVLQRHGHSTAADLESLFYSFLDVASGGGALHWAHACHGGYHVDVKQASMCFADVWKVEVLDRCMPELQGFIQALHDLFFRRQGDNVYEYVGLDVTPAAFLDVCQHNTV